MTQLGATGSGSAAKPRPGRPDQPSLWHYERPKILSPKRPPTETVGLADIFPYYAGFSFEWACSQLQSYSGNPDAVVLDPWNGSGTTTLAAQYDGYRSVGVDLNPVANLIARARCHLNGLALVSPPPSRRSTRIFDDPLCNWFTDSSVARLRDWTRYFGRTGIKRSIPGILAIFRAVRKMTSSFEGSNPTWVKKASADADLISVPFDEIDFIVTSEIETVVSRIREEPKTESSSLILRASASNIPLKANSVDLILTSPPYLTRIDYGVAYARELAVLGINIYEDRSLRSALMGTTLIRPAAAHLEFGGVAKSLLKKISSHESKASSGYYLKQTTQYMLDLSAGMDELSRVAKPGSYAFLVVQDSYYKDIPVPLAEICIDEASNRGWVLDSSIPFPVIRSLMTVNRHARSYKKGTVSETVIGLRRK
ncbi:DNA methylase [Actinokineospora spheciospongiae]|nr:DNA methylase [Actinokineospora spheciospongiae]